MSENDVLNHRVDVLEDEVKALNKRVNGIELAQAQSITKLDSMLLTLGELKESIEALKRRPGWLWDKLIVALLSAVCGAVIGLVIR